jgi:hypothetical protein
MQPWYVIHVLGNIKHYLPGTTVIFTERSLSLSTALLVSKVVLRQEIHYAQRNHNDFNLIDYSITLLHSID